MSDSDDSNKQKAPALPAWQQAASKTPPQNTLELAKKFLEDDEVRDASREKKADFLKIKGVSEQDIQKLLEDTDQQQPPSPPPQPPSQQQQQKASTNALEEGTRKQELLPSSAPSQPFAQETKPDHHPPIVTYPEFLTKPAKPPPLITASGLLNALGIITGLSTLVYGTTKYVVSPMVETLTEARVDFHEKANKNLSQLVEKLEHTVSEIPTTYHSSSKSKPVESDDDDSSDYDDPTELFHRDIGVQTSPPASPAQLPYNSFNSSNSPPRKLTPAETTQYQADCLSRISLSARNIASEMIAQAEDFAETKNVLDKLGGDLHALTYPPESFGVGSSYLYGTTRSEPDDEIKQAKMNIRSVKGVLLSTRNFPATTR